MKLFLNGGGSRNKTKLTNKKLNEVIDHNKPALYIPLAMDESEHSYDSCYEWINEELSLVDIPNIEMVRTFDELKYKNLFNYSFIFIGGGNTYKLLKGIKENGTFDRIKEYISKDGIVIGGSAGAVIFGKDIDIIACMDERIVKLEDTSGFNCINGLSIFPHYTNMRSKFTEEQNKERHIRFTNFMKEFSKTSGDVIAIPEEDTIYVDDNNIRIIGTKPYYKCIDGIITMYKTIDLIPYTDDYYDFVYETKKNAYKKYVEECWGKWDEEVQREYFKKFISKYYTSTYIIKLNNNAIGFYNDETLEDESYEVGNICIIPEYQGLGIGTQILKEKLSEHNNQDIKIQYFKQNPVGKLYERLGFIPDGETEFHYQMIKKAEKIKTK